MHQCQNILHNLSENRLDHFWRDQECLREWKASLSGIGSRSFV